MGLDMDKKLAMDSDAAARKRAEAKAARLLAIIFGGFIIAAIIGMMVFDSYGEKVSGAMNAPADAADR